MPANPISPARRRLQGHLWPILQTAVAAVAAWYLAVLAGAGPRPTFASIAAVVSLGATFGERRHRAVQLVAGVVTGIVMADLLVRVAGRGLPQIGLLVVLAMGAAVLLGGGELLVSEAAVSAILVASLAPSTAEARLLEVLIGGGVALVVHDFVFAPDPVIGVARATNTVLGELGSALHAGADALATGELAQAQAAAQAIETLDVRLRDLKEAVAVGADTARSAPPRRAARSEVQRYARTVGYLDLVVRDTGPLERRIVQYVRAAGPRMPRWPRQWTSLPWRWATCRHSSPSRGAAATF